jgi:hypothetical protein
MKEELSLYGNEYSLFDTFYNGKETIRRTPPDTKTDTGDSRLPRVPSPVATAALKT